MLAGVTACPECGGELTLTQLSDDRPIAELQQVCNECNSTLAGTVVFYPDGDFTVVCEFDGVDTAIRERKKPPTTCRCGRDVTVLTERSDSGATGAYCPECCPGHCDVC